MSLSSAAKAYSALVIIPSYNSGARLLQTVRSARAQWQPVWVVIDGSTDGSQQQLETLAAEDEGIRILALPKNCGKGAAVLLGISVAYQQGYTHALCMDADDQHPAHLIGEFLAAAEQQPRSMILGAPVFGQDAPLLRVRGRRISNWWANLETPGCGKIGDSLYGFRVYPLAPLLRIMRKNRWMRRYDFDAEAVVRLCWAGVTPVNLPAPVRYFSAQEGGISHFRYWRDNASLTWMHIRLLTGFLWRLPHLLVRAARR